MKKLLIGILVLAVVSGYWASPILADYTLVLKNGRRITVQSYREQGSTLHIQARGGEIGIPKDQVQAILKSGETDPAELNISDLDRPVRQPQSTAPASSAGRSSASTEKPPLGELEETVGRDEAADDQQRLAEINKKLNAAQARYLAVSQGGGAAASATKEGYRAWTADLMSRLKTRRGASDSEYEPLEKELRDLRLEIDNLQRDRDALLTELQNKRP
jgi:hypothetical protein